jgi:hypothetical protein
MSRNVQKKWTFIGKWKHLETSGNIWKPNTYFQSNYFVNNYFNKYGNPKSLKMY